MTLRVEFSRRSLADRDRVFEFLSETNLQALADIAAFPQIGRPGPNGFRKLIIRFGKAGYEIRYRLYPDRVLVTRIFHTREDR